MGAESVLKSLSRETKALMIVSEFEARRMPVFQMRAVLKEILVNEEEKKTIIDLVENDLKATGYHPNQIGAFLQELLNETPAGASEGTLRTTRRLRSPFAQGFDAQPSPVRVSGGAGTVPAGTNLPSTTAGPAPFQSGAAGSPAPASPGVPAPAVAPVPNLKLPIPPPRAAGLPPLKPVSLPKVPFSAPTPLASKAVAAGPTVKEAVFFGGSLAGMHVESKPTILLADDDKRIRIVFRLSFERFGYRVVEAEDGNEAWKKIQEGGLSLACLDMKMPGLHGLEVLTRMTNKQMTLPVIICSAYDQLKDEFVIATYPKLRYLVKPVSSEALEKAVKELLGEPAK